MPARMISRMYAPSLIESAVIPARIAPLIANAPKLRFRGKRSKPNSRLAPK
jgi:hypothetical protein